MFVLVPKESPEGPLEIPDVMTFRVPSGDMPGRRVPAWKVFFRQKVQC